MLTATLKPKTCTAPDCGRVFMPFRPMQDVCGPACALRKVRGEKKAERASTRARKEKLKRRRDWLAECQVVANRYVRLRDAGKCCISCNAKPGEKFGGSMDAGHYRSVGSAPHLRFFLPQIRLQCVRCNRYLSGNCIEFRRGLIEQIGLARVEEIDAMQGYAKWDVEYLKRLKRVLSKMCRRKEKRNAMQG